MATTHPPAQTVNVPGSQAQSGVRQVAVTETQTPNHAPGSSSASSHSGADHSMVPSPITPQFRQAIALSAQVARLPVELDVSVPISNFRVRNLLALEPSHLIESGWAQGEDMPLAAGSVQLAWSEFEVVDTQLAVRVTRMA